MGEMWIRVKLRKAGSPCPHHLGRRAVDVDEYLIPPQSEAVGTRTRDQRIKSPLLYRLSYSP